MPPWYPAAPAGGLLYAFTICCIVSLRTSSDFLELSGREALSESILPIGNILSDGALSPLISEPSPEVRKEAIQQIVKAVEITGNILHR